MFKHHRGSLVFTALGLLIAAAAGWHQSGTLQGAARALFIVSVLGVLEVSLSFDNAVVNATVLRDMPEIWRRRFMTWGILVAVVGMRVVLPLAIVALIGSLSPIEVVMLAATQPDEYARVLQGAHISVSAFGGAFLAMVGLKYFFDTEKDVHWIGVIERRLSKLGRIQSLELGIVMVILYAVSKQLPSEHQLEFVESGVFGLVTYIAVAGLGDLLGSSDPAATARSGFSSFMYLEVLDASFSFDGVIGAFALSTNLLIIAIGLGIGALFVRSLTVEFVERGTLTQYRFLEHGAFYAIIGLGVTMFMQAITHVPEAVSGLLGAVAIGLAYWSSVRHNRANPAT